MKIELEFSRNTAYESLSSPDDRTFKVTLTEGGKILVFKLNATREVYNSIKEFFGEESVMVEPGYWSSWRGKAALTEEQMNKLLDKEQVDIEDVDWVLGRLGKEALENEKERK